MIKVGVTGGIGSGKTAFCKELERLGAFVLYADPFARQLMQDDPELQEKISTAFGKQSYTDKGELKREYLAKEAFEKGRVEELNEIVHPLLWKRIKQLAEQKEKEGVELFVVEAAVLLNKGRPDFVDYVILLQSDRQIRIDRVVQRDQSKKNEILQRMNKQPDFEKLIHLSDIEVINDGTLEDLKSKAIVVFKQLKKEA